VAALPEFEVGQRISSHADVYYKILQRFGVGGNSHVYLVECLKGPLRGVLFALKLFVKVNDATRLGRFNKEIDFLKECDHPAVMKVYDFGESVVSEGGVRTVYPFVIADFLPKTLRDSMRSGLSMVEKLSFTLQLLSALSYISEKNIVHRDIKPENIFVRGKGCILGDFGLMKILDEADVDDKDYMIESTGPRLPRFYRTPDLVEYCKGRAELTTKSDVFQLGIVLSEMYSGDSPLKECKNIFDEVVIEAISSIGGSQSAAISAILRSMLDYSVDTRPNAHDLLDPWEGIFLEVVKVSHQLEGKIF